MSGNGHDILLSRAPQFFLVLSWVQESVDRSSLTFHKHKPSPFRAQ